MSAFVVSFETMQQVVSAILAETEYGSPVVHSGRFAGVALGAPDAGTAIGRKLYAMNLRAVRARYPSADFREDARAGRGWTHEPAPRRPVGPAAIPAAAARLAAALKAMDCLEYQCSEGREPETKLFRELVAAKGALALHVVRTHTGSRVSYEEGTWG